MPQKSACYFAKERLNDVEPRAMRGRQDVLKAVGMRGRKCPRLFGEMRGMIIQYEADRVLRRIPGIEVGQKWPTLPPLKSSLSTPTEPRPRSVHSPR